jgi:hypothetical protein
VVRFLIGVDAAGRDGDKAKAVMSAGAGDGANALSG